MIIITLFIISCSKEKEPVVAKFGKYEITLDEFRIGYLKVLKQPAAFDSKEMREKFLDEMINRRLLAEEARKRNFQNDQRFQMQVEAYRNKCLRETHYEYVIEPRIKYDDSLLKEVFQYTKEQRKIKHLFFNRKAQADSAYKLLQNGISFEQLAAVIFKDEKLANSGGDLGWLFWDQMEYDMAMQAFRQKVNNFSKPVKSSYGYHILKIEDQKKELFVTQQDYQLHRDKTINLLKAKMGDKIAYEYINDMMEKLDIKVRTRELEIVGNQLTKLLSNTSVDSNQISYLELSPQEIDTLETTLWDIKDKPLFFINDNTFTVGQFISALTYLPPAIVRKSFKTALNYAIRDFQLTQEAVKLQLAKKSKNVSLKVKIFEDYLLQIKIKKKLIKNISVSDDEVIKMYRNLSKNNNINNISEDEKQKLTSVLLREKKATEVPRYIEKLKKGLKIEKNVLPIHSYYDSIKREK